MGQRAGEVSTGVAARLLEVHPKTVREWARETVSGNAKKLPRARRDIVGRYWIPREDVLRLREQQADAFF